MKILNWIETVKHAVKHEGKPGVFVYNSLYYDAEEENHDGKIWKFVKNEIDNLFVETAAELKLACAIPNSLICFDTSEEAWKFYNIFKADLTNQSGVYACLVDVNGIVLAENS